MPCYDHRDSPDYIRKEMSDKVNNLTNLLCLQCKTSLRSGEKLHPSVAKWYLAHEQKDAMRKQLKVEKKRREVAGRRKDYIKLKKEFG